MLSRNYSIQATILRWIQNLKSCKMQLPRNSKISTCGRIGAQAGHLRWFSCISYMIPMCFHSYQLALKFIFMFHSLSRCELVYQKIVLVLNYHGRLNLDLYYILRSAPVLFFKITVNLKAKAIKVGVNMVNLRFCMHSCRR